MSLTPVTKSDFRQLLIEKRRRLSLNKKISIQLFQKIRFLLDLLQPKQLGVYVPIFGEPDFLLNLWHWSNLSETKLYLPAIVNGEIGYYPWNRSSEMRTDELGILAPKDCTEGVIPDVILIPCVGHDFEGHRLGYGKGFFDRYLTRFPTVISIGISFEKLNLSDNIFEKHDKKVHYVVTCKSSKDHSKPRNEVDTSLKSPV